MERWSGKVALVTGASAGIGASITEELAKNGMKVVGLARRVEKVEELKKNLGKVKGEIFPLQGDVSKEEDINKAFEWIKKQFGTIHVLVNNAGIARSGQTLVDGKIEHFKEILDVNVLGLTICTQKAVQLMKESGVDDGHIVHINSVVGHIVPNIPGISLNLYAASKHAVTALTETLRQELRFLKSKIRVTSISPGATESEILQASVKATGAPPEIPEEFKKHMATMQRLKSKDIADSVVYVLSTPPRVQVHELIIKPLGEMV